MARSFRYRPDNKVTIYGGFPFPSMAAAMRHFSPMLAKYSLGDWVSGEDARCLTELLRRHHPHASKKEFGVGSTPSNIHHWEVRENLPFKGNGFKIVREDGTLTGFSFRKCINPPSHEEEVLSGARRAIMDQMEILVPVVGLDPVRCGSCGWLVYPDATKELKCEVHHIVPFEFLWPGFMSKFNLKYSDIRLAEYNDDANGTTIAPGTVLDTWIDFHHEHAKLTALHAVCHRERTP